MQAIRVKIAANKKVRADVFCLSLAAPAIARKIRPGQFLFLLVSDGIEPFLRRPFSLYRIRCLARRKQIVEILYRVIGRGTLLLSRKKPGETVDVLGPLGNGFTLPAPGGKGRILLVAGGMGAAPLYAMAEELVKGSEFRVQSSGGKGRKRRRIGVLVGAKSKNGLLAVEEFKKLGTEVLVSTDDGSRSRKGMVTGLLAETLRRESVPPSVIYACGPRAMLKETARLAASRKIPCQVAMEEMMACGMGVCRGCVISVKRKAQSAKLRNEFEYKTVCKDGPVFDGGEVVWE